jgi:hypothetical protein
MTGTPSRTATALDGGVIPVTPMESYAALMRLHRREGGWRGSCRQSPGPRNTKRRKAAARWANALGSRKPNVIRAGGRRCDG